MAQHQEPERKIFSYEAARRLLPHVQRLTEEAVRKVEALEHAPGTGERRRQELDAAVDVWVRAITDLGVEVKGLWLVDFDNGSGYYCWRYPEDGLDYFHSYEEGFQGRMRIQ